MKLRTKVAPWRLDWFSRSRPPELPVRRRLRRSLRPSPPPAPAAQPAPAASDSTFTGTVGVLLVQVKGDQTAAYESLITKLKESLGKNEKPERKAMAAGWKVYKSSEPMNGNTLYVHIVDPVSAGQNYLETYKLISETFPAEVQDLYGKTKDAFVPGGLGRLNLTLVSALGGS